MSPKRDRRELKILLSGLADQGIKREADEEVHEQAGVGVERPVARQAEMSCKQEVGQVAQDNGQKSLEKVNQHKVFRRRVGGKRIRRNRRIFATDLAAFVGEFEDRLPF